MLPRAKFKYVHAIVPLFVYFTMPPLFCSDF